MNKIRMAVIMCIYLCSFFTVYTCAIADTNIEDEQLQLLLNRYQSPKVVNNTVQKQLEFAFKAIFNEFVSVIDNKMKLKTLPKFKSLNANCRDRPLFMFSDSDMTILVPESGNGKSNQYFESKAALSGSCGYRYAFITYDPATKKAEIIFNECLRDVFGIRSEDSTVDCPNIYVIHYGSRNKDYRAVLSTPDTVLYENGKYSLDVRYSTETSYD